MSVLTLQRKFISHFLFKKTLFIAKENIINCITVFFVVSLMLKVLLTLKFLYYYLLIPLRAIDILLKETNKKKKTNKNFDLFSRARKIDKTLNGFIWQQKNK